MVGLGQGKSQLVVQKSFKQPGSSISGPSGHESAFCQSILISRWRPGAHPQLLPAPEGRVRPPDWLKLGQGKGGGISMFGLWGHEAAFCQCILGS